MKITKPWQLITIFFVIVPVYFVLSHDATTPPLEPDSLPERGTTDEPLARTESVNTTVQMASISNETVPDSVSSATDVGDVLIDPADALIDNYFSREVSVDSATEISEQLAPLLEQNPELIDQLLTQKWPTYGHKQLLLSSIDRVASEDVSAALRNFALIQTESTNPAQAYEGLELLSSMNIEHDATVTQRLLDIGWTSQSPAVLMRVTASLTATQIPSNTREQVVALLSEMARSGTSDVRALAVQRLGEWGGDDVLEMATSTGLNDHDPSVRASSIRALTAHGTLLPEQRTQFLSMLSNPQENSIVKISAAEALSHFDLSEYERQIVNSVLVAEGIIDTDSQ